MAISYIVEIEDEKGAEELLKFADNKGWSIHPFVKTTYKPASTSPEKAEALKELFKQGADSSNFGDPVEWQRETRKDRKLPYRD